MKEIVILSATRTPVGSFLGKLSSLSAPALGSIAIRGALEKARTGYRMGNMPLVDSMIKDGLWDPYKDIHMGNCAEMCAGKYHFTREEQDAFSLESYKRAQHASKSCLFGEEIVAVPVPQK